MGGEKDPLRNPRNHTMPRAHRTFAPDLVWHLTHRCHKKEFLLRFARDRRRWVSFLNEATRRFDLGVLNHTVARNHIHLLVLGRGAEEIARSMQWIAGRTAQEYNQRRGRRGAFWEDRYHATAVEAGEHLARCLVYIDLNMVRASVVSHPAAWADSGYREIQGSRQRYRAVDVAARSRLLGMKDEGSCGVSIGSEWRSGSVRTGRPERATGRRAWRSGASSSSRGFASNSGCTVGIV